MTASAALIGGCAHLPGDGHDGVVGELQQARHLAPHHVTRALRHEAAALGLLARVAQPSHYEGGGIRHLGKIFDGTVKNISNTKKIIQTKTKLLKTKENTFNFEAK